MTEYLQDLDERSEFPSEDEAFEAGPARPWSWPFIAALLVMVGTLVASGLLLP